MKFITTWGEHAHINSNQFLRSLQLQVNFVDEDDNMHCFAGPNGQSSLAKLDYLVTVCEAQIQRREKVKGIEMEWFVDKYELLLLRVQLRRFSWLPQNRTFNFMFSAIVLRRATALDLWLAFLKFTMEKYGHGTFWFNEKLLVNRCFFSRCTPSCTDLNWFQ